MVKRVRGRKGGSAEGGESTSFKKKDKRRRRSALFVDGGLSHEMRGFGERKKLKRVK